MSRFAKFVQGHSFLRAPYGSAANSVDYGYRLGTSRQGVPYSEWQQDQNKCRRDSASLSRNGCVEQSRSIWCAWLHTEGAFPLYRQFFDHSGVVTQSPSLYERLFSHNRLQLTQTEYIYIIQVILDN